MLSKIIAAAGIAVLAAPVTAQQNTQCSSSFGILNCTTTGQPSGGGINWSLLGPPADVGAKYREGLEAGQRQRALADQQAIIAQQQRALAEQAQSSQDMAQYEAEQRALGVRAGKLIAEGDCPGATNLALAAGNLELASKIKEYCAK